MTIFANRRARNPASSGQSGSRGGSPSYQPRSVLEVGCGYGRVLCELAARLEVSITGIDFSPTQLETARRFLPRGSRISLVLGRGERLPFADQSFDLVYTSAVILHNPPVTAEAIRREVLRVSRRFTAHNEETDVSYNRYGYDTAAWYRARGIELAESGPIPADPDQLTSQFCVAVHRNRSLGGNVTVSLAHAANT